MSSLSLQQIGKRYGSVEVMANQSLEVRQGEFVVFLGPSGCGKTTLLRMVAGLESVTAGRILINGEDVTHQAPGQRNLAMVFQHYALYPHMTVRDNLAFGLRNIGVPADEVNRRVAEAARMLELDALLARKPGQLSGGQRQRVAIGRAVVKEPGLFLFDEPLSNLDAALRARTRIELARLHQRLGATMVFVTHDQIEAMTLATRIVVMNAGVIEQVGTPLEIYRRPATRFVAGFIGTPGMNFVPVQRVADEGRTVAVTVPGGQRVVTGIPSAGLPAAAPGTADAALTLGVRPENLLLTAPGRGASNGTVELVEFLGERTLAHVALADGTLVIATASSGVGAAGALAAPRRGEPVGLALTEGELHLFDARGQAHAAPLADAAGAGAAAQMATA